MKRFLVSLAAVATLMLTPITVLADEGDPAPLMVDTESLTCEDMLTFDYENLLMEDPALGTVLLETYKEKSCSSSALAEAMRVPHVEACDMALIFGPGLQGIPELSQLSNYFTALAAALECYALGG